MFLSDFQLALLEQANEDATHLLRQYFRTIQESLFLEMFEAEAEAFLSAQKTSSPSAPSPCNSVGSSPSRSCFNSASSTPTKIWSHNLSLNMEKLFMGSALLLPAKGASESCDLSLRLPLAELERAKYVSFCSWRTFECSHFLFPSGHQSFLHSSTSFHGCCQVVRVVRIGYREEI